MPDCYMRNGCIIFILGVLLSVNACKPNPNNILQDLHNAENIEEFYQYSEKAKKLNYAALPIFVTLLNESLDDRADVFNYGKTGVCLLALYSLASKGVYTLEEMPVLFRALNEQLAIADTLVTADILKIITGLDVGYDRKFIEKYQYHDEVKRQKMIDIWKNWYKKQLIKDQNK